MNAQGCVWFTESKRELIGEKRIRKAKTKQKGELTNNNKISNLTKSSEKHVRNSFIHVTEVHLPGFIFFPSGVLPPSSSLLPPRILPLANSTPEDSRLLHLCSSSPIPSISLLTNIAREDSRLPQFPEPADLLNERLSSSSFRIHPQSTFLLTQLASASTEDILLLIPFPWSASRLPKRSL